MDLNPQQEAAIRKAEEWWKSPARYKRPFILSGYAGTGKTTIAFEIVRRLGINPVLCAPTGKAAKVLELKIGQETHTLHKFFYRPRQGRIESLSNKLAGLVTAEETGVYKVSSEDRDYSDSGGDPQGEPVRDFESLHAEIEELIEQIRAIKDSKAEFDLVSNKELSQYDAIFIDEASMVDEKMRADLETVGLPIIISFDPFQLPPVGGKGGWNEDEPDALLTQIMRQGDGSHIVHVAHSIRTDGQAKGIDGKDVMLIPRRELALFQILDFDLILCGTNRTRREFNAKIRSARGFERQGADPQPGERLICLRNNYQDNVRNGELFTCRSSKVVSNGRILELEVEDDQGDMRKLRSWRALFTDDSNTAEVPRGLNAFTWGYVLTVHKAQGSEGERVAILDDWKNVENRQQWLYTALTRARTHVRIYQ